MKHYSSAWLLLLGLFVVGTSDSVVRVAAQRISPREVVPFTVGGAKIVLAYGRPLVNNRRIFGVMPPPAGQQPPLVPFDKVWRTGADEATRIESDKTLKFGTATLTAKTGYSLFATPGASSWTLAINKKDNMWGTQYEDFKAETLGTVTATPTTVAEMKQLTIAVVPKPGGGAQDGQLTITWAQTRAAFDFSVTNP